MEIHGPDALAVWARCTDRVPLSINEGGRRQIGRDGAVWWVFQDSGTSMGILDAEEQDDATWRAANSIRLFADRAELEEHVARALSTDLEPHFGSEIDLEAELLRPVWSLDLRLRGSLGYECRITIDDGVDGTVATHAARDHEQPYKVWSKRRLARSELERLKGELRILAPDAWTDYASSGHDGLDWTLVIRDEGVTNRSSGKGSFPPTGDSLENEQCLHSRLLLAVARATGLHIAMGDTPAALATITDPHARADQLLLAALREWGDRASRDNLDPHAITEGEFQKTLLARHLDSLAPGTRQNVTLRRTAEQPRSLLAGWPNVGALDVEMPIDDDLPAWLELKWAKNAGTLENCAWDAAKLGEALREGRTSAGYLVAGAPLSQWSKSTPGRRLFESSLFANGSIVTDFASSWNTWLAEDQGARDLMRVANTVLTVPVGRTFFKAPGGDWWSIRVSRVASPGTDHHVIQRLGPPGTNGDSR